MSRLYIRPFGVKIYITIHDKGLLFSIPKLLTDGRFYDFHFHIGLTVNFSDMNDLIDKDMIFFHKTIQVPEKNGKKIQRCYFPNLLDISNVEKIVCRDNKKQKMMSDKFPFDNIYDIHLITEILKRPFLPSIQAHILPVVVGGSLHMYRGKKYKMNIGSRGGKYIIVNNKKKYI